MDDQFLQMRGMMNDMNRMMNRTFGQPSPPFSNDRRDPFFSGTLPLMDYRDNFLSSPLMLPDARSSALAIPSEATPMTWDFRPCTDVLDMGDRFVVSADLPGMQKEDVSVDVNEGMLNITAEHKEDKSRTEGSWVLQERRFGKFQRKIRLPENVKESDIQARFNNGVLEIDLPKEVKDGDEGKAIIIQ
eukprot:GHVQ01000921.1.p1 GENE.GHVQ01000921.1~~GHVQ01000921.1.p1  ORF type:complete len:188 (+),score=36.36 GHVQ01000921.1:366-929(+)